MPHLSIMNWNANNQLYKTGNGTVTNYNQYSGGQWVRKIVQKAGGIVEERLYMGKFELYRKYTGATLNVQRITVYLDNNTGRLAMYERVDRWAPILFVLFHLKENKMKY